LEKFKKTGIHYAFVSDEYGCFSRSNHFKRYSLETLVGMRPIFKDDFQLEEREDGSWLVDGHYSLHDFLTYFELDD
jgi:putative hemolysin